MRFALPTLAAAIASGAVGAVIAERHWAFAWLALAMAGVVVVAGLAALIAAMIWREGRPVGHPVGL